MTKNGHNAVGFFCAVGSLAFSVNHPWLTALGIYLGATAPDWLEIAWYSPAQRRRMSVIEHRTWTHWIFPWLVLLVFAGYQTKTDLNFSILFGFAIGGLCHLLVDWPNPTGIPIFGPFRHNRNSLKLWRSGEKEIRITLLFAAMAISAHLYFGHLTDYYIQATSLLSQFLVFLFKINR